MVAIEESMQQTYERTFAINLMQHLAVPTFVLDPDCRVIIWNEACERLTGVSAAEVLGTRDHWQAFYAEPRLCLADVLAQGRTDELKTLYSYHIELSKNGFGLTAENWCVMPRLGISLYLAIDAGPIYAQDGQLIAVVETLRDLTDHKNAQTALQQMACLDGLTSIANRRGFDERLKAEWSRAQRQKEPLSLILADVDFFKLYNDLYGHQSGDECLKEVAGAIKRRILRGTDLVARYGGEEFTVILPNTDLNGACIVAEGIRSAVETMALPHATSKVSSNVTLSLGVACQIPNPDTEPATLILQADQALYAAKDGGRNRVYPTVTVNNRTHVVR